MEEAITPEVVQNEEVKTEPAAKVEPPKQETPPQTEAKDLVRRQIEAAETGVIIGGSFEDQYRLARLYCASRMLPAAFDTPEKVFTAMQFAYELGLKGITAMRNICVINGTPSLWGDLPLALVKRSGKLKVIKEWTTDEEGKEICPENNNIAAEPKVAYCRTVRKDDETENEVTTWFSQDDSRKAGLLGNAKKEIWTKYMRRMLQMRARGQNLKDNFGDVLMGAAIAEYDHNAVVDTEGKVLDSDVRETKNVAAEINKAYLDGAV